MNTLTSVTIQLTVMSSGKRIPEAEWERRKVEIEQLYVKDDLKREDVMTAMANRHGFRAR